MCLRSSPKLEGVRVGLHVRETSSTVLVVLVVIVGVVAVIVASATSTLVATARRRGCAATRVRCWLNAAARRGG